MKQRMTIVAMAAVLSLVAAACGDDAGDTTTTGAPPATEGTVADTTTTFPDATAFAEAVLFVPPVPRNEAGEPIDALWPEPELCDPGGPEFIPATELVFEVRDDGDPVFGAETLAASAIYENPNGQAFEVTVSGADLAELEEFVTTAAICVETQPAPVELDVLFQLPVVDVVLGTLGGSLGDLADARDELGDDATLRDAATALFGDAAAVEADAAGGLAEVLQAAVDEGLIAAEDAAAVDVPGSVALVFDEPGAPFLIDPALDVDTDEELLAALGDLEEEANVVVTIDTLEDPGEGVVVSAAIDPSVGRYRVRGYRAKCARSVRVAVTTHQGRVRARLWHTSPYKSFGTAYASAGQFSGWRYGSSSSYRRFDTSVEGLHSSNSYTIHGGWWLGTGGGC